MSAAKELQLFILRGQVIALYRSFQRAIRQAPPESKGGGLPYGA